MLVLFFNPYKRKNAFIFIIYYIYGKLIKNIWIKKLIQKTIKKSLKKDKLGLTNDLFVKR